MAYAHEANIVSLNDEMKSLEAGDGLAAVAFRFPHMVTFSTSFSMEDQVITHLIASGKLDISVFTLDTGRLFHQTYSAWSSTLERYEIVIQPYYPNNTAIEQYVKAKGPNAFYASVGDRKECCYIRKVELLKRALAGNAVWVTGLRAEHSPERQHLDALEWDESNNIIKYHPLLHWTTDQVTEYVKKNNVPYNSLHDKGFISIGCEPCTRAVKPGEAFRAGRWWWEDASKKECGLHIKQ